MTVLLLIPISNKITLGAEENIVLNPSFEDSSIDIKYDWEDDIVPKNWEETWKPTGNPTIKISDEQFHSGKNSIEISSVEDARASVTQDITVESNQVYALSAWIKTEDIIAADENNLKGASLRVTYFSGDEQIGKPMYSEALLDTNDWKLVEKEVVTEQGIDRIRVQLMFEPGTGTAWYDDISLIKTSESELNLKNSSFENFDNSSVDNWTDRAATDWNVWKPSGNPVVTISEVEATSGSHSLEINAADKGRAAVSQDIDVIGGKAYKFSGNIKTKDISNMARFRLVYYEGDKQLELVHLGQTSSTADWKKVEEIITPPDSVDRIRVQSFLELGTGTAWFDDINLTQLDEWVPVTSIDLEEKIDLSVGEEATLNLSVTPANATNQNFTWVSSNEAVVTVNDGVVNAVSAGMTVVTVFAEDESIKDTVTINVIENETDRPAIESIEVNSSEVEIDQYSTLFIETKLTPDNASAKDIIWSSDDEKIATVKNGFVTGINPGSTKIVISSKDGSIQTKINLTVNESTLDEYDILRLRWKENLLGENSYDENNPKMKAIIESQTERANTLWDSMNKNQKRSFLWNNLTSTTDSSIIRDTYRNLYALSVPFVTEESELYQDPALLADILSGLEWMYENKYNSDINQYSNWWHWEIGAPQALNNVITLMYDYLDEATVIKYMDVIDHFQPDPTKSGATTPDRYREALGANRIDVAKAVAVRGILVKESDKIAASRDALSQVFEYVTSENGFYEDGSFVQHEDIAYTGSYGIVLIEGLTELLELFHDTTWEVKDKNINNVYDWVYDSFMPLMHKGRLMDMIRGRAISRMELQDHQAGANFIKSLNRLAQFAPAPHDDKFKQFSKHWMETNTYYGYVENSSNFRDINLANDILLNDEIVGQVPTNYHKFFPSMDRSVHHQDDFTLALSMYSNRIQNYEFMNTENGKGWYTGAGMTYLYNNDLSQYNDGFWPTVDSLRLPGTTVSTKERNIGTGLHRSTESWVGGSVLNDKYASIGFSYNDWDDNVKAKKSYFMFNNEIIALGSDISSEDGIVETIVENRKINQDASNSLLINGNIFTDDHGIDHTKEDVNWALLEGSTQDTNIGYYFPDTATLKVKKEERTGAWHDINSNGSKEKLRNSFATLVFDHGDEPEQADYAYVILPGKNDSGMQGYAENPNIAIIKHDANVHAIEVKDTNILAANFWTNETHSADIITSNQAASVTLQLTDEELNLAVSDPTMENEGLIELELDISGQSVEFSDERIQITQLEPTVKLDIDVSNAKGASYNAIINLKQDTVIEDEEIDDEKETVDDEEVEEDEVVESDVDTDSNSTLDGSGEHLPKTATPFYNFIVYGVLFILIGLSINLIFRYRRA